MSNEASEVHSHLIIKADIDLKPIWWQVIPVLVTNASDWPTKDGSSGITITLALNAAVAGGAEGGYRFTVHFSTSFSTTRRPRRPNCGTAAMQ
jgi:hypothetical protein